MIHPEIWLGDYCCEERGVAAETFGVNRSFSVHIHSLREEPARNFHFVVVDAHVEQGRSRERRSTRRLHFIVTSEFRRKEFFFCGERISLKCCAGVASSV